MPFPVLSAFLCLGGKYDIRKLEIEARRRLYSRFPLTLEEDDVAKRSVHEFEFPAKDPYFQVLKLAHRAGLISILPRVLYYCCETYPESFLEHGGDVDGSTKTLSVQDQNICLAGREAIFEAQAKTTCEWLCDPDTLSDVCATPERCNLGRQKAYLATLASAHPIALELWPMSSMRLNGELCEECATIAWDMHKDGREYFWEQLPELFDLSTWDVLAKEREDL